MAQSSIRDLGAVVDAMLVTFAPVGGPHLDGADA
jgi:hypothetical protein